MYKLIAARGHEIASHSWSHPKLPKINSQDSLIHEIVDPINYLYLKTDYYPVSFVHPHNQANPRVDSIIFRYYLFSRVSSVYSMKNRFIKTIMPDTKINLVNDWVEHAAARNMWLIIAGHGLNGVGWRPVTSEFLNLTCKILKGSDSNVWIGTLSDIGSYEYLKDEIKLNIVENKNGISVNFLNLNLDKYKKLKKLPITVIVPLLDSFDLKTNSPDVVIFFNEGKKYYSVTWDLKLKSSIELIVKKKN